VGSNGVGGGGSGARKGSSSGAVTGGAGQAGLVVINWAEPSDFFLMF
jgi:hypothetical protein